MKLDDKRVIVTGASGGLGPSLVEALLAVGAEVIAVARRRTGLDALRAEMRHHERLEVAECDVADPEGLAELVDAVARGGAIDGLVHAAGAFRYGPLIDQSDEDVTAVIRSNVVATTVVLRAVLRRMAAQRSGAAVVISADRALEPAASFSLYGAAKAAVTHLVQATALEVHPDVRVNAILPGTIDTPANREAMPDADPSGWTSPRAIARTAVWLLGSDAEGVSGALVRMPGA